MKKPQLVLLHGWGLSSFIWQSFIPYLEDQFTVLPLDLLGFGYNRASYHTINLDSLTQNILDHSPLSALFLGWSLGGLVAMNIAIHYPSRIQQLITIASTPKFIGEDLWPGMTCHLLEQFARQLKIDYQATLQHFILLQFRGSPAQYRLIQSLKQQVLDNPAPSTDALNQGLRLLQVTDLRDQLINIQCPQLYLLGHCDTLVPSAVAEKINHLTKRAQINVLPKVSHAPFLSNPALCAQKIKNFYNDSLFNSYKSTKHTNRQCQIHFN